MKNNKFRKSLVIGVILLFVGVAILPGLNADTITTSNSSDTIEIKVVSGAAASSKRAETGIWRCF